MLSIRDYLIVLITNTNHKAHLLSCALRCSSKLQKIQSLENFVSMTIQVHKYQCTQNIHCFCIFLFFFFFEKQNKNMLNKAKYKTRLTLEQESKTYK